MNIDFEEMKKIHNALEDASNKYDVSSFKPWESKGGTQYITIQLIKKEKE